MRRVTDTVVEREVARWLQRKIERDIKRMMESIGEKGRGRSRQ